MPVHEPLNPKLVLCPALSLPLYDALTAVTAEPLEVIVAFQKLVTVCPLANVHLTVHELIPAEPAVTVTLAPKPPAHSDDLA